MRSLINITAVVMAAFMVIGTADDAQADENPCVSRIDRTACEAVLFEMRRNTSKGTITRLADHCDAILQREGEPTVARVVPRGKEAFSPESVPLPGITWAAKSKAGIRFRELGLMFSDRRVVVEKELCRNRSVWAQAFALVGVTRQQIASGEYYVALCGETFSHHVPAQRILNILDGVRSRGQYSVLSKAEERTIVAELTKRGY